MRFLTQSDFESTGWAVDDPDVQSLVNGILTTQEEVFAKRKSDGVRPTHIN